MKYQNYISAMRKIVGHAPLMITACGIIIENDKGEILLQKRRDNGNWGLPGGAMELGEKYIETLKREVLEEAGIEIDDIQLFGIYSGEDRILTYPNGDICCVTSIIFKTSSYRGEIQQNTEEAVKHCFFDANNLPENINLFDEKYVLDWKSKPSEIIVD